MQTITQNLTTKMMMMRKTNRSQMRNNLTKVLMAGAVISTSSLFSAASTNTYAASGWPEVMSSMPADTQIVICADNFTTLDKHWSQFVKAVELEQFGVQKPSDILAMMGPAMEHVDLNKSGGVAIVKNHWGDDAPPFMVFMPVSNYQGWAESISTGVENGLNLLDMGAGGGGEQWYAKKSGSYAVMSMNNDLLSAYTPANNAVNSFQALTGTLGSDVVARNDIVAIIDFDGLNELVRPALDDMMEQVEGSMEMMGSMGGNAEQMRQAMAMYSTIIDVLLNEGQCATIGVRSGAKGIVFDGSMQWKPDSTFTKFFKGTEKPKNLLTKFDKRPFLLAISMDLTGCDFAGLFSSLMERLPEGMQSINNPATANTMEIMKKADGLATVIYPSPAGLMGGLLNAMVTLYTGDVPAIRDAMQKSITELNGKEQQGISFITEYAAGDAQIDDINADTYSMQMKFAPEMAQANQAMGFMYGPGGVRGYIVSTEQGLLQTVSRNKVLVRKMVASLAANDGLANDEQFSAFDDMLPENPTIQGYLGIGAIVGQLAPMAQMFIQGVDFETMANVPPIGFAVKMANGGVQKTVVIPAPLIKAATEMAMQIQSQFNGGDNMGDEGDEEAPMF